jgi:RecA/RadA recombinase
MDRFLNGGLLARGILEVFGESASCKTLFCLQLALTVQKPLQLGGLDAGVRHFPPALNISQGVLLSARRTISLCLACSS